MSNFAAGREAEGAAADYLYEHGYTVIEQNWRTPLCEIDIVARKGRVIYCVEVKYRLSDKQGKGFDYITPRKLKQMEFAARLWAQEHDWDGDYHLSAIEVSGHEFEITNFLSCISKD